MRDLQISSIESLLQGVGVAALPGEKLVVTPADTVRVRVTLDYRGSLIYPTLYGAIGNRVLGFFNEYVYGTMGTILPEAADWATYTALYVDIPMVGCPYGTDFDVYVKLLEYPEAEMPELNNVIDVVGVPEFANFAITSYEKV